MESFSFNLQTAKGNASLKHLKLQRVTILLRVVEICIVLVLISRLSMMLPSAVRNSSEYLKDFSVFNSHYFVFLIGNIIIITLFAQGSGRNVQNEQEYDDIYEKLVRKSIKHEEKEKIRKDGSKVEKGDSVEERKMKRGVKKSYRRCESENLKKQHRVLQRCESENNGRKNIEPAHVIEEEMIVRILYPEDKMSNEEFRRTVEAFIAKNRGFEG